MCLKGNRQCQVAKCFIPKILKSFALLNLTIHVLTIFPVDKPIQRLLLKIEKEIKKKNEFILSGVEVARQNNDFFFFFLSNF